ncbi:PEP/pyruvate-binding domain-containing protein [Halovulum sp. GXIMD14794]
MTAFLFPEQALDPAEVGGKAAALARLTAEGFDVPPFLVLSDAAFAADGLTVDLPLARLGPGPYAVRSSARGEDGAEDSHAGQFDTLLNVDAQGIAKAALAVRASGDADRIAEYRRLRGLSGEGLPAVIVQCMVPARTAGVAFSADPVSGVRGRAVISATRGLGDALVSGEVDGEGWTLDAEGTLLDGPAIPAVLTLAEAQQVAALARSAETLFGIPQDIEWAFEGDRLLILQARPITTPLRPEPAPDTALVVLDNSNIIESYPGHVSPLTYSFAAYCYDRVYRSFVRLLGMPQAEVARNAAVFANLLARVDGRVYYNLGNWYRALALLPGFRVNRGFMETMMGVDEPLPTELTDAIAPQPSTGLARLADMARLTRVGLGLIAQALLLPRTKRRFMARLDGAIKSAADTETANLTRLARDYRTIEAELLDRWDAPLVNDFLCMIGFGLSRKMLEKWAGPRGLEFHNDVMIGQGDIVSAEPVQRIARMASLAREAGAVDALAKGREAIADFPALATEVDAYLAAFGDRCTEELKLESTPLSDDPTPLLAAIRAGASRDMAPRATREPPDWTALIPDRPVRRAVARAVTGWARARVRDRENLRFERTRIFGQARRVFRAMGRELHALGVLDDPRDIFELTVQEVLGAIEGAAVTSDLRALAALRKAETEVQRALPDPPRRILLRGAARVGRRAAAATSVTQGGDTRTGTGCSAGVIRARARVIRDPLTERLEAGEILVAANTDPGWIAVFANASGIVVERGSLLSHSAIVARELGIPCVVGISDATCWIEGGEVIEVDGGSGLVRKVDD